MKDKRQQKVLEIIEKNIILTQDELQSELEKLGFNVTQSTVSRDIKELRLVKGHDENGNYRYIVSGNSSVFSQPTAHYRELFSRSVKSIEYAMNDIVIKCYNGMAQSTCVTVDAMLADRMLGSIAGDDTIVLITRSENEAKILTEELRSIM